MLTCGAAKEDSAVASLSTPAPAHRATSSSFLVLPASKRTQGDAEAPRTDPRGFVSTDPRPEHDRKMESPAGPSLGATTSGRKTSDLPLVPASDHAAHDRTVVALPARRRRRAGHPRMCYGYHYLVGALHLLSSALPLVAAAGSNPQCLTADAMIGGMRHYLIDWDKQLDYASNKTWTCEDFAKFMYNSRDRIQQELFYTYSNMTTVPAPPTSQASDQEDGDPVVNVTDAELPEGFGDLPWIMSHVNKAASLVSASVHVNSGLGVLRQECFQEPAVHLLFFVSLRRIHQLMLNQMKYLWYLMQNTPEMYRGAATQWIMESSQVFRGDLDTVESIFGGWNPPNTTKGEEKELVYSKYEKPKVVSIVELLRRQTFKETDFDRELVRASMRHVFDKNDLILELGAGVGDMSRWLNETGWVQAHGYDYSADIELITFNNVHQLRGEKAPPRLGDGDIPYDWLICVSEQCPMMWSAILSHYPGDKLREYTKKGIIVEKTAEGEMDLSAMKRSEPHATVYANRGLGEKYTVYTH